METLRNQSVLKLKQRIIEHASARSDTRAVMLAEEIAALHQEDHAEFKAIIQEGHVSSRKMYYLLKVGRLLRRGIISRADVEKAGWTRIAIVAPVMDRRTAARLVRLAQTFSAARLTRIIRDEDDDEPRPNCVQLHLSDQQYDRLKKALKAAGAKSKGRGLTAKEDALMAIIDQWAGMERSTVRGGGKRRAAGGRNGSTSRIRSKPVSAA